MYVHEVDWSSRQRRADPRWNIQFSRAHDADMTCEVGYFTGRSRQPVIFFKKRKTLPQKQTTELVAVNGFFSCVRVCVIKTDN